MITSIQIHEEIKRELDTLKESNKESYEDIIKRLIESVEKQKRIRTELLIEGYKEMARESLDITKEWAVTETNWD
ncbi:MAG: antitoxin VapB family protein [Nanoarchaeota archaeon]